MPKLSIGSHIGAGNKAFINKNNFQKLVDTLEDKMVFLKDREPDDVLTLEEKIRYYLNSMDEDWKVKFDAEGNISDLDFAIQHSDDYGYISDSVLEEFLEAIAPCVTSNNYMLIKEEDTYENEKVIFKNNDFARYLPKVYYTNRDLVTELLKAYGPDITLLQIMTTMDLKDSVGV